MDVQKPELECIDGICYRINPCSSKAPKESVNSIYNEDAGECSIDTGPKFSDEDADFLNDIEAIEGERFRTSLHVPMDVFPLIIGSRGATKRRIESETRTKIMVPRPGQIGDIIITGPDKYCVALSRKQVKGKVFFKKKQSSPTHFISIPLNNETFKQNFLTFKNRILESYPDQEFSEELFQKPDKLHLTVCLLVLLDDVDRAEASELLQICKQEVITPLISQKKLLLEIAGLDYMNDDQSAVKVLYAKAFFPEYPNLLQELVDCIASFFKQRTFVRFPKTNVKIHVTVMNTAFTDQQPFDASAIMKDFGDFNFGKTEIDQVELSVMHSTSESGYYVSTAVISIP